MTSRATMVSVCVLAYNHRPYIAHALDSVLMQQADFEVVAVVGEDCSTDGTRDVVLEYHDRSPGRVHLLTSDRNVGVQANFVRTMRACRGQYVAFLDGDDYWTSPQKLQRQVEFLERHPHCSTCFHNVLQVHEDETASPHAFNPPNQPLFSFTRDIVRACHVQLGSAVVRRDVIERLPRWWFGVELTDWGLFVHASELGPLGYLPECWGVYRVHPGGYWSGRPGPDQLHAALHFYRQIDVATGYRHHAVIQGCRERAYRDLACLETRAGNRWASVWYAARAFLARPLRRPARSIARLARSARP